MPDRTVLLRLDTEVVVERARDRCEAPISDRFEGEGGGARTGSPPSSSGSAAAAPERLVVVDAAGSVAEVHARVVGALGLEGTEDR